MVDLRLDRIKQFFLHPRAGAVLLWTAMRIVYYNTHCKVFGCCDSDSFTLVDLSIILTVNVKCGQVYFQPDASRENGGSKLQSGAETSRADGIVSPDGQPFHSDRVRDQENIIEISQHGELPSSQRVQD